LLAVFDSIRGSVEAMKTAVVALGLCLVGLGWGSAQGEDRAQAQGQGLSMPLGESEFEIRPDHPARLVATRPDPVEASQWTLVELPTQPGYVAALCVRGQGWTLKRGNSSDEAVPIEIYFDPTLGPIRAIGAK